MTSLHPSEEILHVRNKKTGQREMPKQPAAQPIDRSKGRRTGTCNSYGDAQSRHSCKFRQAECHNCQKKGHLKRPCRALKKDIQNRADLQRENFFDNGRSRQFILDTGSPVTFLPRQELLSVGFKDTCIQLSTTKLRGVLGHSLQVLGQIRTRIRSTGTQPS